MGLDFFFFSGRETEGVLDRSVSQVYRRTVFEKSLHMWEEDEGEKHIKTHK